MRLTSKYLSLSESLQSTLSPERSSSSNFLSSTCAVNHLSVNQTEDANITELYQPCSGTSLNAVVIKHILMWRFMLLLMGAKQSTT